VPAFKITLDEVPKSYTIAHVTTLACVAIICIRTDALTGRYLALGDRTRIFDIS
jgi:hypothetical protein